MKSRCLAIAMSVVVGAIGCARSPDRSRASSPDTVAVTSEIRSSLGVRVGPATDPMVAAMAPRLREWVQRWRTVLPGFSLDSLYRESAVPFDTDRQAASAEDLERARIFGERSPDSTRIVEPDSYREKGDSWLDWGGDADSAPAILDLRSDSLFKLTVIGPSFYFEDAFWVDRDHCVLVGTGERTFEPWRGGGDLWLYDLARKTLTTYHTPDATRVQSSRYLELSKAAERMRVRSKIS